MLDFQDTQGNARVVGVARRMPSVPADTGPFVLADAGWLSTAINSNAPGEGSPSEVWISAPGDDGRVGETLARPPFANLVVASRAAEERQLAGDPLAHATAVALGAAGLVALVLAVLGFWVGVVSELHDEKSDFFDLEAQGLAPADMRKQLRMRGVILLVLGVAGGLALAVLLSRLVVSLIRVSGTTGVPEPSLRLDPNWLVGGLGSPRCCWPRCSSPRGHRSPPSAAPAGTCLLEPRVSVAIDVREAFRIHRSGGATSVALQGLTLQVEEGEIVVVLGPSGSGKTTLLRTVAGFDTLSAGTARVLGTDVGALGPGAAARFRAENLGLLDQHYARALSPDLSSVHSVALGLELLGTPRGEAREAAAALLGRVGLGDR